MASPGILDIQFSKVGSVDSNYYGVNVLDSASVSVDNDTDTFKSDLRDRNFITFPNAYKTIDIDQDTNPLSITAALTSGSLLAFGSVSEGGGGGASQADLDSANALIASLRSELESAGATGERWE